MSDITQNATLNLDVNSKRAEEKLSKLKEMALNFKKAAAEAAAAGDKITFDKMNREYRATMKQIKAVESATKDVESVMRRLDRATPKELKETLRTLNRQLQDMERNSKAWLEQTEKIKKVKAELESINNETKEQDSLLSRLKDKFNDWGGAIATAAASFTGLVLTAKQAVQQYADMQGEMANVIKYTGMTEQQVNSLNEAFKKMDTRTSREDLNKLAQEAGRLGKTSEKDVLGYVKAADQINVALDDLGEGATQTLSKLTSIFGDEKRLGTEKALLSVGSVINELSQNCSASAPYLAEFAKRMAGVGSQANMSVQELMGFAAVLDSNGQNVEKSSTALAQVITRIYQDPAKYARAAGLDVQRFTQLVRTDANEAVLELLDSLNKMGNMDALAPMFKELGENGSGSIATLSTLAKHIAEVRSQQQVANQAYNEATSITKEFNVQNNTVQAGLDKAKKGFTEVAVSLGEKLAPIMSHVISGTSATIRVLNTLIEFIVENKTVVLSAAAAIVLYQAAMNLAAIKAKALTAFIKLADVGLKAFSGAAAVGKVAVAAMTNGIQYFTNGLRVNYDMQQRWRRAMDGMSKANWVGLVLTLGVALVAVGKHFYDAAQKAKQAREEARKYAQEAENISKGAAEYSKKEIAQLDKLYNSAVNAALSTDKRRAAAEKLQKLYPDYFKNMSEEQIMLGKARKKYDELRDSILKTAMARAAQDKITENSGDILESEGAKEGYKEGLAYWKRRRRNLKARLDKANDEIRKALSGKGSVLSLKQNEILVKALEEQIREADREINTRNNAINKIDKKIDIKEKANKKLADKYGVDIAGNAEEEETITENLSQEGQGGSGTNAGSGGVVNKNEDKFAAEKAWREKEEALNRIAYATGKKNYVEYTDRMNEIEVEFYKKQLAHTKLGENERLQIQADYWEAVKKQQEQQIADSVEGVDASYNKQVAELKQLYLNGEISKETFDTKMEEEEIAHQQMMVEVYKEGTKERAEAEKELTELLTRQMEKRKAETEKKQKEFNDLRLQYFGLSPNERNQKMKEELNALDLVFLAQMSLVLDNKKEMLKVEEEYQKAKSAIIEKYSEQQGGLAATKYGKVVQGIGDWLKGPGGEALTGTLDTVTSSMSAIFSQMNSMVQSDLEMQTAEINKRYEAEIEAAEGNSYKVAQIEKRRDKEIAEAKNKANKKMFAMQVIQAVAQTAQNAIAAYGSAAAIPVVGFVMAPIAAAMAVAAGALQIAAIKKQAQQAESTGYAEGGFTPKGDKYQPVGVVHAGEWVASQALVNSPQTRPLLDALDYAQRNNTIGSFRTADVAAIARPNVAVGGDNAITQAAVASAGASREVAVALDRLSNKLNEPLKAYVGVTGEDGINKANSDYQALINNKNPKR